MLICSHIFRYIYCIVWEIEWKFTTKKSKIVQNLIKSSGIDLIAVKLGDLQDAIESFERAHEMAKLQGDEPAQKAISKALEELNQKIVQGIKEGQIKDDDEEDKKIRKTMKVGKSWI